jgi:hypothetical protein
VVENERVIAQSKLRLFIIIIALGQVWQTKAQEAKLEYDIKVYNAKK